MKHRRYHFSNSFTDVYYSERITSLKALADPASTVLLTDEHVFAAHARRFSGWNTIVLKPGESYKVQATVDAIIEQLIEFEADRSFTLVGVGGGVVTDLAGYVASIYMRGIRFGFVPTSILGLVDASIGGKNGIDVGPYKNLAGVVRQPAFILHDLQLLRSLPEDEWVNGFAEIIKHACIRDRAMFRLLTEKSLRYFRSNREVLASLIQRNAALKLKIVQQDEWEKGERRLLNFGHTLGHPLETKYELLHGQAIAIGMTYACHISEKIAGFRQTAEVVQLLEQYNLPTYARFDSKAIFRILKMDKKRSRENMNYVLLERTGKAVVRSIDLVTLEEIIQAI